jgi:SrtB family sortase
MDIAISVASTVNEIHESSPSLGRAELFSSGMRVGRDLMGANSATLILAFAGGSLSMLVSNYVYDLPYIQIINSYGIGIEIMEAFSASFGIILAVPIVAAVSAFWMGSARPAPAPAAESKGAGPEAFSAAVLPPAARKLGRLLHRHWKLAAVLLCLAFLAACGLRFYSVYSGYQSAGREYERAARTMEASSSPASVSPAPAAYGGSSAPEAEPFSFDYGKLTAQNSDAVGWLRLPGTVLSYPVVQGKDNAFYLDHTFYKTPNTAGAIFLDSRIRDGLSAKHSIVYGHNMRNGSMFAALCNFRDEKYYKEHPVFELYGKDGKTACEIFSVHEAAPDGDTYACSFSEQSTYGDYLKEMTKLSLYDTGVKATAANRILTLSTCVGDKRDMRFVVQAKLGQKA